MVTQSGKFVAQEPNPEHPTGKALCVKGKAAPEMIYDSQRLLYPVIRTNPKGDKDPGWKRISWEEALAKTAEVLARIRYESGPEAVAFSVATPSGTATSDDIRWVERLTNLFGSPNVALGAEICNWHKDFTHAFTFGRGISSPDFEHTQCILLWGHNPSATWLDHATATSAAKARGAKVIVIDPRRAGFAVGADQWLRVRPGSDGALALGISRAMISNGWFDKAFVSDFTNGPLIVRTDTMKFLRAIDIKDAQSEFTASDADKLVAQSVTGALVGYDKTSRTYDNSEALLLSSVFTLQLKNGKQALCKSAFKLYAEVCEEFTPEKVQEICWVNAEQVTATARLIFESGPVCYYCWSGVAQHTNASQTDRAIATMMALTGSFDAKGGNVEFSKPFTNDVSAKNNLSAEQRAKCLGFAHSALGPAVKGWVTSSELYHAILEKKPYPIRAMMGFGRNFLLNHADADRGHDALSALEFYAHADNTLNPTAHLADIVFPINTPWERQSLRVGFEGSEAAERLIQLRQAAIPSEGESHSDAFLVFELAKRLGLGKHFWDGNVDAGLEYFLEPLHITLEDLKKSPNGISIPTETRYKSYLKEGFKTDTGKIELFSEVFANHSFDPLPRFIEPAISIMGEFGQKYPLVMTSSKTVLFRHGQDRQISSLRQRNPDPEVSMHPDTGAERDIREGEWVYVTSPNAKIKMRARFDINLDPKVVWLQYGWWQANDKLGLDGFNTGSDEGSNYSRLISDKNVDPISGSSALRSGVCEVEPIEKRLNQAWNGWRKFKVLETKTEAKGILSFMLAPTDELPLPKYLGGQHITIRCGPQDSKLVRCYSLSSGTNAQYYRISVKLAGADKASIGKMSAYLHQTVAGMINSEVELMAPKGNFHIKPEQNDPASSICLIAGGIGITPIISILYHLSKEQRANPVELFYAVTSGVDHAFAQELQALKIPLPQLKITTFYSKPSQADIETKSFDVKGRMSIQSIPGHLKDSTTHYYLCGPGEMVSQMTQALGENGIDKTHIHTEAFGPTSNKNKNLNLSPQPITLLKSGKTLIWSPESSLLELIERAGVIASSGCRVGQCESCSVQLVKGNVSYPDGVNAPMEGSCLICVAIPLSPLSLEI